ncbi:hypothetical protein [Streptomyces sp. PSAA01]|uniref:hypothetical protein n=1 Tax=Streptomyces sp. PSAA01 TaxID=2912762 RepID=UPI001F1D68A0|nr:hypothetical protein [Streptomyces sp. PSAA01]MCG0283814.1 hypothetical protein [Streptomyces sp. PSAA01]
MKHRQIRRQCYKLVRSLDLTHPFSVDDLSRQISQRRNKPITLAPLTFPAGGPVGMLASTATVDYVFYESNTTVIHQTHAIVHEFGHLLWGHESAEPLTDTGAGSLLPDDLDPTLIQHLLGRTQYSHPEEYAAEYFATQVLHVVYGAPSTDTARPQDMSSFVSRLERSLRPGRTRGQ